ncbi:hypothetical protein MGYG_06517 [Nannizzia gypsea CBS 118893]|uniref:PH domain-containing protein n=1 Tax=Arthroderma gypseum (strain ATCC MYA-4604 / CBS 118893) TaxID=535722 RepID=E4UZJ0_ARTGP|nr:hypothetical protein MGYG_06517 [Nannizzia gypsea CBS 118893]EFR03520.1 hypothetical protein MGYG_06517 [Nannizzia gypsea CBS 118893]
MAERSKKQRRKSFGVFGSTGLLSLESASPVASSRFRAGDRSSCDALTLARYYSERRGQADVLDSAAGAHLDDSHLQHHHDHLDHQQQQRRRLQQLQQPLSWASSSSKEENKLRNRKTRSGSRSSLLSLAFVRPRPTSSAGEMKTTTMTTTTTATRQRLSKATARPLSYSPSLPFQQEDELYLPNFTLPHSATEPNIRSRSKSVNKTLGRSSVFGSLRSLKSMDDDQHSTRTRSRSTSSNEDDLPIMRESGNSRVHKMQQQQHHHHNNHSNNNNHYQPQMNRSFGVKVLHHGEVQTAGAMWRKRSHYLVLTESHLVRFKSQSKAAEVFPSIPSSWGRSTGAAAASNRFSMVSLASLHENQLAGGAVALGGGGDGGIGIALNSIIAVHRLDDGKPYFSVEVCYADEKNTRGSAIHIQLSDPQEAQLWLMGIRAAAETAISIEPPVFDDDTINYVTNVLEQERDYDPDCFGLYRVVHRMSTKQGNRASTDDITKLASNACLLAIGAHKIHILPTHTKSSNRASMASLVELDLDACLGIMALSSISVQANDDTFQLIFRIPFKSPSIVNLSSSYSGEIALFLRQRAEYLRPGWIHQPFAFNVPPHVQARVMPPVTFEEDYGCFDRTLIAYCAAYDVDTSKIRYMVDYHCEDAPAFQLLPREGCPDGGGYLLLELLAVFRALRYNESFCTISFARINLDILQQMRDSYGPDFDALRTRSNVAVNIPGQEEVASLTQEVRALALKSRTLQRMDFSYCLTRSAKAVGGERDPGCGIPEAVFPLCRRSLTRVDWLALNGIELGDSDLDYLVDAASQKTSALRAFEANNCGLQVHDLNLILSTLRVQKDTLKCLQISNIVGRLSPDQFQQQAGCLRNIRKLELSQVLRTSKSEPLISAETLLSWELEELCLNNTTVNEQTVESIAMYLASPESKNLREMRLNQCGITGGDVATLLYFMVDDELKPRDIHLHVNDNRLAIDCDLMFASISQNRTSTHLTMRSIEFQRDEDFRHLLEALTQNNTLQYLDISRLSLPHDAGADTSKALQSMFEQNSTIQELDISSEQAHLDVSRFGIGLNLALTGLKKNNTLKVLKIEHQKLGVQGANTLASVIEENDSLTEIHCENNEINLQAFTIIVNALQKNKSLVHIPSMASDCKRSLARVQREMEADVKDTGLRSSLSTASSIRRSVRAAFSGSYSSGGSGNKLVKSHPSVSQTGGSPGVRRASSATLGATNGAQPGVAASASLPQISGIFKKLASNATCTGNYNILQGLNDQPVGEDDTKSEGRPATAASLTTFLNQLSLTPIEDMSQRDGTSVAETPSSDASALSRSASFKTANNYMEDTDTSKDDIGAVDFNLDWSFSQSCSKQSALIDRVLPGSGFSSQSHIQTDELAAPVSTQPRPALLRPSSSVRSSNSTSTVSINTNTSTTMDRIPVNGRKFGTTRTPSLRGMLTARNTSKKELQKKPDPNTPPQLDWNLPEINLL